MSSDILKLPDNLPVPEDDGACSHLVGMEIPDLSLSSSSGRSVNLREISQRKTVLFIYPRAGSPLEVKCNYELWDLIPGARGCTPQSCAFRDSYHEFLALGVEVFALSVQKTFVHKEFIERNHIPFQILSDSNYELVEKMNLPTFEFDGVKLIKRMTLILEKGKIIKVFYPVFPPDKNASEVLRWLKQ